MPRLPGPEALGKRPAHNPSAAIVPINPADRRAPSLREPIGDLGAPDRARVALGESEIGLGTTMESLGLAEMKRLEVAAKHEQERQDALRAEDAFNALRNKQLDLTTGQGGYATLRGAQAVNQPILTMYSEQFEAAAGEIAATLQNDEQRALFSKRAAVAGLQFKEGILHHTIKEGDTYATEVFKGIVETETRAAIANWSSPADVQASLARIDAAVATRAERGGWPASYAESVRLKENSDVHSAVISEALASGNMAYAQKWYDEHKDNVDKATAVKLQTAVRDGTQRQAAAQYTGMLLQARDSMPALDELERRLQADKVLDETRKNALLGQVMNRRDTLRNALDRQDAKNERAYDRWERNTQRAIDAVRNSLPYGEPSMAALEPLITATQGTALAGEVNALVNTANATRQFRFAPALQQEALLTQARALARTDPSKVDVQMVNTLQSIYDGQQRQLKESGIKFVVSQGLVKADNPAVAPLDTSSPAKMATLPQRLQLARNVTDQYQAPFKPLTPEEADLAKATLQASTLAGKRDWFAKLAQMAGTDFRGYNAVIAQIAPDEPVLAIAGIAANRRLDDGKGRLVADLLLRGQEILNPPPKADGKPDQGRLLPMPPEAKMRLDFDNTVRDAFAGNAQARSDYYQASRAIYAARSIEAGDKDTTILNGDRWQESMRLAMGNIADYNGRRTILPWGMDRGQFTDQLADRVNLLSSAGRLPESMTPSKLRDLPLQPIGDGRYVFRSGDSVVVEKAAPGKPAAPIVIDFNQSLPYVPSGARAGAGAPLPPVTKAEEQEAAQAARARVRPKE